MSLRWDWNAKCGEAVFRQEINGEEPQEFTVNLYKGNACLIMIYEYTENGTDKYSLYSFWADKEHMKNCLGLNKKDGYGNNMYTEGYDRLLKIRLNKAKNCYTKDIVAALVQAFDSIDVEIYTEE